MTTKTIIYVVIAIVILFIIKYVYDKGKTDATSTTTISPATTRMRCPDGQCVKTKTVGDITYSGCYPCNSASI